MAPGLQGQYDQQARTWCRSLYRKGSGGFQLLAGAAPTLRQEAVLSVQAKLGYDPSGPPWVQSSVDHWQHSPTQLLFKARYPQGNAGTRRRITRGWDDFKSAGRGSCSGRMLKSTFSPPATPGCPGQSRVRLGASWPERRLYYSARSYPLGRQINVPRTTHASTAERTVRCHGGVLCFERPSPR